MYRKYLKQFSTENYTWKIVIIQNVLIPSLVTIIISSLTLNIHITVWCKNCTWIVLIIQNHYEFWQFFLSNFLISKCVNNPNQKISQGTKYVKTPKLYTTWKTLTMLVNNAIKIYLIKLILYYFLPLRPDSLYF